MQRLHGHFAIWVSRKLVIELSSNATHLCLRLSDRDVVFQASHHAHKHRFASDLFGRKRERHPHLRVESIVHARRKNADNCVRLAVHAYVLADEISIRVEMRAPDSMTENHDVVATRFALFRKKVASEQQRQSFHREKAWRATRGWDLFWSIVSCD